ncbi:MAG: hypothetical protein NT069_36320 [Planctomycetota bacterium]|nr:hypothetical protein [Planctomycetota bacterium]
MRNDSGGAIGGLRSGGQGGTPSTGVVPGVRIAAGNRRRNSAKRGPGREGC